MIDESPPPRRGLPPEDESPTPMAPGRRWADAPADLDFFAVPPPAPVLPTGSGPSSPGRRFSADDLPDDWTPPPPEFVGKLRARMAELADLGIEAMDD